MIPVNYHRVVTTVEETKSDSQRSSKYEEFKETTKCIGNFKSPEWVSYLGTLVKIDRVQLWLRISQMNRKNYTLRSKFSSLYSYENQDYALFVNEVN